MACGIKIKINQMLFRNLNCITCVYIYYIITCKHQILCLYCTLVLVRSVNCFCGSAVNKILRKKPEMTAAYMYFSKIHKKEKEKGEFSNTFRYSECPIVLNWSQALSSLPKFNTWYFWRDLSSYFLWDLRDFPLRCLMLP